MTKPKRIFVVGHMGAGKALFSEALAKKLQWEFIDANPSLERYIGRSLKEIMGQQGEDAFHRCEGEIISHYRRQDQAVILLEEAVIVSEQNRQLLATECVIYLKVSVSTQLERMKSGRKPLLPIPDLKAFLEQQHHERDPLFEEVATVSLDSVSVDPDVDHVISALSLS